MCQKPLVIDGVYPGEKMSVQCRKCDECMKARKRHWIGRLMAEEQTANSVWFTTLTYAGGYDNPDAYWLQYDHVQKMFKRLRKAGHKFKYVVVGEHGSERERAHWHVLFYWNSEPPEVPAMDERIQWDYWKHGSSQIEYPRSQQGAATYIMDYMNKDNLDKSLMKYSKNPMLGEDYLISYAKQHARHGLPLFAQGDRFTIPDNLNRDGENFFYPVGPQTGMYTRMLDAFLLEWATVRPDQRLNTSQLLNEYLSDLVQDTNVCPEPVQRFLEQHYGYSPTEEFKIPPRITTYTMENCNVTVYPQRTVLTVFNQTGETIWEKTAVTQDEGRLLTTRELESRLDKFRPHAPDRVLRFLPPTKSPITSTSSKSSKPPCQRSDEMNRRISRLLQVDPNRHRRRQEAGEREGVSPS
ncbi:replication initiator protein [Microviridae sp.]|nr:replication initiator protein [Microviridae sp.]